VDGLADFGGMWPMVQVIAAWHAVQFKLTEGLQAFHLFTLSKKALLAQDEASRSSNLADESMDGSAASDFTVELLNPAVDCGSIYISGSLIFLHNDELYIQAACESRFLSIGVLRLIPEFIRAGAPKHFVHDILL